MKRLIFILFCLFSFRASAQVLSPPVTFNTRVDMRLQTALPGTIAQLNGLVSINDYNGGNYMWDATSNIADDGFLTLQVAGVNPGRWVRIGNNNTIKFNKSLNGTLLQTAYPVTYGGTLPFVPITVIPIPRTSDAAALSYITNITNTGFTINFVTVPVLGTQNLNLDFIVVKQ